MPPAGNYLGAENRGVGIDLYGEIIHFSGLSDPEQGSARWASELGVHGHKPRFGHSARDMG
jgi:hypothetical protein